jgi:predicted Rossmann-fold nucleotide-binding protein
MPKNTEITRLTPHGSMDILSQLEVSQLKQGNQDDGLYETFRRCALAVLNVDSVTDDAREVLEKHRDFDIRVVQQERGVKLEIENAPQSAFVDGKVMTGIQEQLFAVLRDISYVKNKIASNQIFDTTSGDGITNIVFHILRNARVLVAETEPNLVVCWGGHSIGREEYEYSKEVGYQLGLRRLNICTGCGPGAMKGPMKGAAIGHAKQRINDGQYLGISEPGIIAAESPNPIVNDLVIMPDIEKRLEAFVRTGHGIVVFPGGAGTTEEILYILGILLHPDNDNIPFPLIFTGPASAEAYFKQIDKFIG